MIVSTSVKSSLRGVFCCIWCISITTISPDSEASFLDQRYRGWLWFEAKSLEYEDIKRKNIITAEQAEEEIASLKENMDSKRSIMIANPNPESVRDYVMLEEVMWTKALDLDKAYREARFKYPEYFDRITNPQNIHAVKFKRKLEQEMLENKIKNFASKFDLVLFSKGSCPYCKEFAPVLKHFSQIYGFKTEEASIDLNMTGLFIGKSIPELAKKLAIEATPTVVAVSKDGKRAFEMIRGYVTTSELEEYAGLASDYAEKLR